MKLYQKLVLIVFLPLIISLGAMFFITETVIRQTIFEQAMRDADNILNSKVQQLDNILEESLSTMRILTKGRTLQNPEMTSIRENLGNWQKVSKNIEAFYYNTKEGLVYGAGGETFSVRDRSYYPVIDAGREVITEPIISRATQVPIILMLVPIFNESNERTGALGATVTLTKIMQIIQDMNVLDSQYAFLFDKNGNIIAGLPDEKYFMLKPADPNFAPITARVSEYIFTKKNNAGEQFIQTKNGKYFILYKKIETTDLYLALLNKEDKVFAPLRSIRHIEITLIGIFILCALFGTWFFFSTITHPVRRLEEGHRILQEGDLAVRLPAVGADEFAILERSFNLMAERIQSEHDSLAKSEENLRITLDSIGDAVIAADINGNIVRMNPVAEELTGWKFNDAHGRNISEVFRIVNSETREPCRNPVEKVLAAKQIIGLSNHTLLISKNNMEYQIADSGAPILDSNRIIIGVVLVFRDITKQYQAEQSARQSEIIFKTIFEASPHSIAIQRASDSKYIMINKSFEKLSGFSAGEIIGKTPFEIDLIVESDFYINYRNQMKTLGRIDNGRLDVKKKNGEISNLVFSSRVIDYNGETCVLTMTFDITEIRKLQEQLNQSQKLEAIGTLAGGVAHDFNNMLGGILGAAEMIKIDLPENSEHYEYVQMIIDTTKRASDLTAKLLTFARKNKVSMFPASIHKIIEDAVALLRRTLDKKIDISTRLSASESTVYCETSLIMNAFINLGINSGHAMPDGGNLIFSTRNIEVDKELFESGDLELIQGRYILIEIQDSGCGISKDNLPKIFDPFFTTKEKNKGTGLGLAAVYGTVKQHNGIVNVYSEEGKGSVFRIYLPIVIGEETAETGGEIIERGEGCIIIVDDEDIMRRTAGKILKYIGYTVLTAENGREAVEIFLNNHWKIDLVILDMIMPVMNGYECFLEMRKIKPDLKVLISSGFLQDDDSEILKEKGVFGLIRKPYDIQELSKAVARILKQ